MIGVAESTDSAKESANGAGGVWEYISPSRLNCWLTCPLRFKFLCGPSHKIFYVVLLVMCWRQRCVRNCRSWSLHYAT